MNLTFIGGGNVVLLAGGGRCFTDIAAKFVGSEKNLNELISSSYDSKLVKNILKRGHLAATEFDYFLFGIEGYSRVVETQLVRKRIASFMVKTGRKNKQGKRSYDVVIPPILADINIKYGSCCYDVTDLLKMLELFYNEGINIGIDEELLRYMKPQATEFKALIGMNAHSLLDYFSIRCCKNAQEEHRDLAFKMLKLVKEASPDLFTQAGASCVKLGYCPENEGQHKDCSIITHNRVKELIKEKNREDW